MHLLKTAAMALLATSWLVSDGAAQDARPVLRVGIEQLPEGFAPGLQLNNVGQRVTDGTNAVIRGGFRAALV